MHGETRGETCGELGFRMQCLATVHCDVKTSGEVIIQRRMQFLRGQLYCGGGGVNSLMTSTVGS